MAGEPDITVYRDALVVLGTAGVVVPMVRHWGLNPVLGYLGMGALLGPLGLGALAPLVPGLEWVTISEADKVAGIAELGIIFLLFLIGLELSFERLRTMRRLVFGLGGLQVVLTSLVLAAAGALFGLAADVAIVVGAALALSSTAIVIELLSSQQRLRTGAGRASFSILLAQDLAIIPILLFIGTLAAGPTGSVLLGLGQALAKAGVAIVLIVLIGRRLLRPLFRLVAGTQSGELFIAATLFVMVATSVLAASAGVSMALGAFVAGLLLAETEYRKAIEAEIEPFKGLLLGVFFFTVGMKFDVRELLREPLLLGLSVMALIATKAALITGIARLFGIGWPAAVEPDCCSVPVGEFAFVALGMGTAIGIVPANVASFTFAVTTLSMALIPALSVAAQAFRARAIPGPLPPEASVAPAAASGHAIVIGYGRVGSVVAELLERHRVPNLIVDADIETVVRQRRRGRSIYFGDATDPAFLRACGVEEAKAVIVTIHTRAAIDEIVTQVRAFSADIPIVSRARDAAHARHLYSIGVTDAVPETIEASLQLSEATLVGVGVPTGSAIASIHARRDEFRQDLQQAAGAAGRDSTRSVKARSIGTDRVG